MALPTKIVIIAGSHRKPSQSSKVAEIIATILREEMETPVWNLDLAGNPLPMWQEEHGGVAPSLWSPIASELRSSSGLVLVVPEWNGMAPPGVKNFLHLCSTDEVGHKPALLVTLSAADNGAYPVSELRMSGYKNNRLCFLPEHLIVRRVQGVFNAKVAEEGNKQDIYLHHRLRYCLRLLLAYATAFRLIRDSGVIDYDAFPNGM